MIKVFADGRITKTPVVFTYGQGNKGVSFSIASNDRGNDEADFLDCVMFNRDESFSKHLNVGDQVIVSGRFKKNDQGYVSCVVDEFEFGAKKQS